MSKSDHTYSTHFKVDIAMKVRKGKSIKKLAERYKVSVATIEEWTTLFDNRIESLFNENIILNKLTGDYNQLGLLQSLFEASPNGVLVTNLDREIIAYNKRCKEMWQIPDRFLSSDYMHEATEYIYSLVRDPEALREKIDYSYQNPEDNISHDIELKDGRFFKRLSSPYRSNEGIHGLIANFIDVTEYKKTEKKLSKFSSLVQSINTNVNEAILRSTPDQGLVYINDAFVKMFGYESREESIATDPSNFYARPSTRKRLVRKLLDEGKFTNAEVLFKRKDGSTFWGLENSTLIEQNGKTYIDGVVTNIDDRKQAEQELRKSEEKYRSILKNIEEGYFETDLKGNFTFFNSALVDIIGYPPEELAGMNNRVYMDKEEAKKVYGTFNKVYRTGNPEKGFDWKLIRGDDQVIYVEASITLRNNSANEPIGFSGMVRDITEQKRKRQQIRNSLKEKEVLLGEIHHRVKNNLAVISGLLYLQADKTSDKKARRALMQSQNRINSMALIHELLYDNKTFANLNPQEYIEQLVEHISSNLSLGQKAIETEIRAENFDLEMRTAIPCALIINELITNAYKYAFEGLTEGKIEIIFQKNDGDMYHLEVNDNGHGLPENFDLKEHSQNSLGLSLVKTLTKQLNGDLETHNKNGAQFIITFND